jgi:hypothetical protein
MKRPRVHPNPIPSDEVTRRQIDLCPIDEREVLRRDVEVGEGRDLGECSLGVSHDVLVPQPQDRNPEPPQQMRG